MRFCGRIEIANVGAGRMVTVPKGCVLFMAAFLVVQANLALGIELETQEEALVNALNPALIDLESLRSEQKQTPRDFSLPSPFDKDGYTHTSASAPRVDLQLHFEKGDSSLTKESVESLRRAVNALQQLQIPQSRDLVIRSDNAEKPTRKIHVVGHTCDVGPDELNKALSEARAQTVKTFLVGAGFALEAIEAKGEGPFKPKVPNDSERNREVNRRVELIMSIHQSEIEGLAN